VQGFDILDEWIRGHVDNSYKIPLSFMIRPEPRPAFVQQPRASLANEYAQSCPRTVLVGTEEVDADWFNPANEKLWDILFSIFSGHSSYGHIKLFRTKQDGFAAYNALRIHHLGKSSVNNLAADIEAQFAALTYTGEGRRWNFKQYVSRHVDLHARAKELERFGYAGIDEASRVRRLMAGIKTSKLDSVKGSIFTQGEKVQNNFEAVVSAYTNFIAQDASFRTSQGNSQIAAVAGTNETDSGGGNRQNKRPQGQISQVNVTDRYYTREEYAKLSKEEKAALHNLRKGRKRHRGNDDSAGMASVAAQLNELKASVRALTASGDVDDDKTVNASNQGRTNRNNPALTRQRRPQGGAGG
jgi:hypothetical protein